MSSLNIYYQATELLRSELKDFKSTCSQSDFDIVCIIWSGLTKTTPDETVVDTKLFDIFRLDLNYDAKSNYIEGTFIAARKHLSAYIRKEWMTEGVDCVWVTVPSRGCGSRLHVACVQFSSSVNIDLFTDNLISLSKIHVNDKFLVVGEFPLFQGDWISDKLHQTGRPKSLTAGKQGNEIIMKLRNSISLAGLDQYNNIKDNCDYLRNLVFSSVPATVVHYPRPLVPEKYKWNIALQFDLDIDPPECSKTSNEATKENYRNVPSSRHKARQKDVNTSGNVTKFNFTDPSGSVQEKLDGVARLLPESVGGKFQQRVKELKAVQKKCERMSKENASVKSAYDSKIIASNEGCLKTFEDVSKSIVNVEKRLRLFEVDSNKIANIEERLKLFEFDSKKIANLEERLKTFEDDAKKIKNVEERLQLFEDGSKKFAGIEERLKVFDVNLKKITNVEERLKLFVDDSKKMANIEERLKLFEGDSKIIANIKELLKTVEDDSKKIANIEERLKLFEGDSKEIANLIERSKALEEMKHAYWGISEFGSKGTTSTSPFTTSFSEPETTPAFGSSVVGTSGLLGASAASDAGLFGTPFGQQGFSSDQLNTGAFFGRGAQPRFSGQPSTFGQNAFGAKSNSFGFGISSTAPAGTGLFGSAPQPSTGLFGQATAAPQTTGMFGFCGGFGVQQATGTVIKYVPLGDNDLIVKEGQAQLINISYNCITFMKEYENRSLEELRLEDYAANRKGPQANTETYLLETPGGKNVFGIPGASVFGQARTGGTFGQSADGSVEEINLESRTTQPDV